MKKIALILFIGFSALSAQAFGPDGYPFSTWGEATRDTDGLEGAGAIGRVSQGISWGPMPWKLKSKTYASYVWRLRTENERFYNAFGPAVGAEISRGPIDVGWTTVWERFPKLDRNERDVELYLTWYYSLDLMGDERKPLSTWARFWHDLRDVEGDGSMGNVTQAVSVAKLPYSFMLQPFASYHWRFRSLNSEHFDAHGPAVGLRVSRSGLDVGASYRWQHYPSLDENTKNFFFYITWYFARDLKKL